MKKVLITGGAGFIGLHLARLLNQKGYQVNLVDNFSRGKKDQELESLLLDNSMQIWDKDLMEKEAWFDLGDDYDLIFHFAAIVGVANVSNNPYNVLKNNSLLLFNALDFAKKQNCLYRFMFSSTSEVYAGTQKRGELPFPTPEDVPLGLNSLAEPRISYMLSKIYGEASCHYGSLPFTIVRPHNIYGPRMGMSHVIPELLKRVYKEPEDGSLTVFSPSHTRVFCYIEDAIRFIHAASKSIKTIGQTLNIGQRGPEIKNIDLAARICKIVGKKLKILEGKDTPGSPDRRCPDMTRTESLTGHRANINLNQGLVKTYEWYKSYVFSNTERIAK